MGPLLVVGNEPAIGHRADLGQRFKEMGIEHLGTIAAVEPLDEGVLIRLARLDVVQSDAALVTPIDEYLGGQLGTVVQAQRTWPPVQRDEFLKDPDDASRRDRPTDVDRQAFAIPSSRIVRARKRRRS